MNRSVNRVLLPGLLVLAALLSGCETTYGPRYQYDPRAVEKTGRVEAKTVARLEERPWGDAPVTPQGVPIPVPVGKTAYLVLFVGGDLWSGRGNSQIPIYEYKIVTGDGEHYLVYSEFPGHKEGDCVLIFLSQQPSYPRMTSGHGCR